VTRWPYRSGDHLAICDRCGRRGYRSKMRLTWDKLLTHPECYDARHPQELIKPRREKVSVKDPRPEGQDVFLSPGDVTADDL
jgi:hypothetical protein